MNIIINHKLINLTQAKKTSRAKKRLTVKLPSEKIGVGYVISEGVCDFRNPCTSRNHVISGYATKILQNNSK